MRRLKRLVGFAVLLAACARMAAPPGGPPRRIPPVLLSMFPDSGTLQCGYKGTAEFRFDEVTSDAGQPNFGLGDGSLEKLVILSPDTTVPTVEWHRDRITVRPRAGWRDHVVYRIQLLPGVVDLHQNTLKSGAVIAFTACGPVPTRTLSGRAIDWLGVRALPGALIQAFHLPDSARYVALADSTGRFRFEGLPDGPYLVVAAAGQTTRHDRDPKAAWDSVRVDATSDTTGEIWTFPRDSTPPRITGVARVDSQTVSVTFAKPIDPAQVLDTTMVRVGLLPDTVSIGVLEARPKAVFDSIHRPVPKPRTPAEDSAFRVDSLKRDSISKARPPAPTSGGNARPTPPADLPVQKRPRLESVIIVRTQGQVRLDQSYWISVRGVRAPGGRPGPLEGMPLVKDLAKIRSDSIAKVKAHADSLKSDSLKKAKGDTIKVIKPR